MKAIDVIRHARKVSYDWTTAYLDDMRDAALTHPTPRGGNHPLWIAGHLAISEGLIVAMVSGDHSPVKHWEPLFDAGTEPTADPSAYPAYDEVVAKYRELYARNTRMLEEIGDAGLDRPITPPFENAEEFFGTVGRVYLTMVMHQEFHGGQLADARRTAGRKPMFR